MLHTDITILNVATLFTLGLDDVVSLLDKILKELFGCNGNGKGGVVGAIGDVFIGMDDLLDTSDCDG